ncbi:MAG: hypothetical protein KDE14_04280 [Rhodobacteraceae bacterium]|nr:hypothetical protein [Paracoccaceae bacterium]
MKTKIGKVKLVSRKTRNIAATVESSKVSIDVPHGQTDFIEWELPGKDWRFVSFNCENPFQDWVYVHNKSNRLRIKTTARTSWVYNYTISIRHTSGLTAEVDPMFRNTGPFDPGLNATFRKIDAKVYKARRTVRKRKKAGSSK